MNLTGPVCLLATVLTCVSFAQDPSTPQLRPGISVQMASAPHATAMPAADDGNAVVVAVATAGKLYIGTRKATVEDIARIQAKTVYVKADARANYQALVDVLDALQGHTVFLLTKSPKAAPGKISPPYVLSFSSVAP
jgi:hypothetical protein